MDWIKIKFSLENKQVFSAYFFVSTRVLADGLMLNLFWVIFLYFGVSSLVGFKNFYASGGKMSVRFNLILTAQMTRTKFFKCLLIFLQNFKCLFQNLKNLDFNETRSLRFFFLFQGTTTKSWKTRKNFGLQIFLIFFFTFKAKVCLIY